MEYQNRLPPEGINISRVHPLKQFVQLVFAAIVMIVILVFVLQFTGSLLAKRIPFSFELAVMERLDIPLGDSVGHPQITRYLNDLADQVMTEMDVPEEIEITVHYGSEDVFNAFATVGGNLLFYRDLLIRMPDENTLAMVMAHEISHVLHRDPIAGLGGGVASTIALLGLTGNAGTGMAGQVLTQAGMLTSAQFTRNMEEAADEAALSALNGLYGHVNGATTLFELFSKARGSKDSTPEWLENFLSTHPTDNKRIQAIITRAASEGWKTDGELTSLPVPFKSWL